RQTIKETWNLLGEQATGRTIALQLDVPPDSVVETDPRLLRIIFSNLVSNAIAHAPEGDSLTIREDRSNGLVLSFSNPAPWLDSSDLPLLFERLWRHDQARTDSSHTGLGLSIARICAERMGGGLDAELDAQKNLVFHLRFAIG
ncbi:MAG: ATP-binding protein, partial [Verrucomicrobiae bacterium]|nr:ATP-binding protein [Verrucomicrobiae bacterium]